MAKIEEIVVITPDFSRLHAGARILQRLKFGRPLWKETRLDLSRDFELLRCAPLGFLLFGR